MVNSYVSPTLIGMHSDTHFPVKHIYRLNIQHFTNVVEHLLNRHNNMLLALASNFATFFRKYQFLSYFLGPPLKN